MTAALLVLACLLGLVQDAPTLLSPTPDTWRYERIDFPLEFAPDLAYEGFEELQFAPGMFTPDSDTYFSYVLAIQLEGDVDVDAAFVDSFLTKYYYGLCRAVARGRNLDLDLSKIAVDVDPGASPYIATISMFDAFTNGQPLQLRLELDVHAGPGVTELFGLASPMPVDAPVWGTMRDLHAAWRKQRPDPVFLNHLYLVLDADTYAAIVASEFLRKTFAVSEERTTTRSDMTYAGVYLYGNRTYFEFLEPSEALGQGASGLAFGLETEGGTDAVAARFREKSIRTFAGPMTRELDGERIPWFAITGVERPHGESKLSLFTMEYNPKFLATWHADLAPKDAGIDRHAVLDRYAASLQRSAERDNVLLKDITEIRLDLDKAERGRFLDVCRVFGYEIQEDNGTWTCVGPQYRIVVSESEAPGGVTAFTMSLRKAVQREPLELGRATLQFDGETATMKIARPAK